jgi:ketosteroid isomerase-like protein
MEVHNDAGSAIAERHESLVRAFNAGAFDRLVAANFADDAFFLPPNLPPVRGRAAIASEFRRLFGAGGFGLAPLERTHVEESGDLAFTVGSYRLSFPGAGGERAEDFGSFVEVWRRQADGAWLCAVDMFNSDRPAS